MESEIIKFALPPERLAEAKIVSLLSVCMLVVFFYYLNRHTKRGYFAVWTAGWMFYALWLMLNVQLPNAKPGEIVFLLEQWCLVFTAVCLLWGSLRFLNLLGRHFLFGLLVLSVLTWTWICPLIFSGNPLATELPVYIFIGHCSAFAGLCFFRLRMRMPFIGAGMLSLGFELWGLYLASYPLARQYKDFFAADFYIGAVLQLFIAVSMIVLVLEEMRLNAEETQAEIAATRSEKETLLAKVLSSEEQCRNLYNQVRLAEGVQKAYEELRHTHESVAQKERLAALGQMASGIVHDINNGLSPILGYSDLLLNRTPGIPEQAQRFLTIINRSADDIARILARMRNLYRSDPAQSTEIDLNQLVKDVVETTRPRWRDIPLREGIAITIECNLEPKLPVLFGDPVEVREALCNLIFNAVDALPKTGTITITTKVVKEVEASLAAANGGRQLCIEVRDNGMGMDEETRKRCLEPFFSTKIARGGTGLGLAMVYGMIQCHGGTIQIESKRGSGTTIRLIFPERKASRPASAIPCFKPSEKRSIRVLCIDDDPPMRQLMGDCLTNFGHQVTVAGSGKEGLELFRSAKANAQPYEIVITDMGMPDTDGSQVAEAINTESCNTPIIMMTGWGSMMREENATPKYVKALIDKPPHLQELDYLLHKLTEKNGSTITRGEGAATGRA